MTGQPRYQNSAGSKLLFFSEILLMAGSFYLAALIDLDLDPYLYFLYEGGLSRVIFVAATILLAMYFNHLYTDVRVRSRVLLIQELCAVFGLALVAQSLVVYVKPDWILPRWLMVYGVLLSLVSIFVWRVFYSQVVLNIVRRQRIVFVGHNRTVREIAGEIAMSPGWGYEVMGYIDDAGECMDFPIGKYLGNYSGLAAIARKLRPDRIVVGLEEPGPLLPVDDLLQLHYEGLTIEEASLTYESLNQRVSMRDLNEQDLLFSRDLTPAGNTLSLQRAIDRLVAALLLVLCLPLMALITVLLRIGSWEPAMVRTRRAGYNGKPFDVWRFRTSPQLNWLYSRFHIDALPELFNVLRGEMAFVGPRAEAPDVAAERSRDSTLYEYRFNVPPGITGWAQINLTEEQYQADPLNALEYDLYYIKHMSQALKTYILMTTFKNRLIWGDQRS